MANRRKHTNAMPVAGLAKWMVLAFFVAVAGLCFVYFKNQQHAIGAQIRVLEKELALIATQNEVASSKIALLSSRAMLQRRLDEKFIKMVPIAGSNIVRLNSGDRRYASNELRPVVNQGALK